MKTEIENIIYNYTFGSNTADCPMESQRNTDC